MKLLTRDHQAQPQQVKLMLVGMVTLTEIISLPLLTVLAHVVYNDMGQPPSTLDTMSPTVSVTVATPIAMSVWDQLATNVSLVKLEDTSHTQLLMVNMPPMEHAQLRVLELPLKLQSLCKQGPTLMESRP